MPIQTTIRLLPSVLGMVMLASALCTAHAGNIPLSGVIPGAGVIHKRVISIYERRYLNLVRQHTDYSCGAAALATVLKYGYGLDADEERVLRGLLKVADADLARSKGFSLLDMKDYLRTIGMRGRGYRVEEAQLERIRMPVIVLLNIKGYKHFVVFKTARDDKVYIADPALGNKILDREEFLAAWNGVAFAILRENFNWDSVLRHPAEPLQAKKTRPLYDITRQLSIESADIPVMRDIGCIACF